MRSFLFTKNEYCFYPFLDLFSLHFLKRFERWISKSRSHIIFSLLGKLAGLMAMNTVICTGAYEQEQCDTQSIKNKCEPGLDTGHDCKLLQEFSQAAQTLGGFISSLLRVSTNTTT